MSKFHQNFSKLEKFTKIWSCLWPLNIPGNYDWLDKSQRWREYFLKWIVRPDLLGPPSPIAALEATWPFCWSPFLKACYFMKVGLVDLSTYLWRENKIWILAVYAMQGRTAEFKFYFPAMCADCSATKAKNLIIFNQFWLRGLFTNSPPPRSLLWPFGWPPPSP